MPRDRLPPILRSLRRQPGYTALNVVGLAVGMATCLLIGLYLHEETQVDRFHEHVERIVQVGLESAQGRSLYGPYLLATALEEGLPGVERVAATHVRDGLAVAHEASGFADDARVVYTEPSFFEVFSFPVLAGDVAAGLGAPDGLVLTESLARAVFGDTDPIGQPIRLGGASQEVGRTDPVSDHTVRAVVRDPSPRSSLQFDVLAPVTATSGFEMLAVAWRMRAFHLYALLAPGTTPAEVEAGIPAVVAPHVETHWPEEVFVTPFASVYLSDLHASGGFRGQRRYLYVFGSAALFILLIAGINYVNLATAQGLRRAREIGVRKSLGASRAQVAGQFLGESVALCLLALVVGLGTTAVALPGFNSLFGTELALRDHAGALAVLAVFVLGVGVAAAAYPAFLLARFDPIRVLRGHLPTSVGGGGGLRRSLLVLQFAASSLLLIGTAVVLAQLRYVQTKDLGFDGQQVVVFELPAQGVPSDPHAVRTPALAHPGVEQVSLASATPGWHRGPVHVARGMISPETALDPEELLPLVPFAVDDGFLETLGIRLLAGRAFNPDLAADAERATLINEAAARAMGWTPEQTLGKPFATHWAAVMGQAPRAEVIGVIEDFHLTSLREEVTPVSLTYARSLAATTGTVQVAARLSPENIPGAMRHLEAVLAPFAHGGPYAYAFLDDRFDALYASERRLARVVGIFAALAVLVAGLGLFGLTALATEQRTKEIGIRKVLGATIGNVVVLLSKDFLKLVTLAFTLAAPAGYWAMSRWLEDFAYRIVLGPGVFLAAGGAALAVALLTVSYHAVRAASSDPIEALRTE